VLKEALILILDEPTEELDPTTARDPLATLDVVASGKNVILIYRLQPKDTAFVKVLPMSAGTLQSHYKTYETTTD
jgi:ABC-type transport system involved in cytochrome bd biosynthesis fused ATPase/permease subunit